MEMHLSVLTKTLCSDNVHHIHLYCTVSEESEEEKKPVPTKKPVNLKFRNKKEAMDAFKSLLKEKVCYQTELIQL